MDNNTINADIEELALRLFDKGKQLSLRFTRFDNLNDLDKAIENKNKSILITTEGHPAKAERLHSLGVSYYRRFQRLGNPDDLQKDISYSTQAVALTPEDHPECPRRLGSLGTSYYERFMLLDDLGDLNKAIEYESQAHSLTPKGHPDLPERLSNLGVSHYQRFLRLGDLDDLDRSINYASKSLFSTPQTDPDLPERTGRLGACYRARFKRLGDLDNLTEAIKYHLQACELTPESDPDYPSRLSNLSVAYHERFNQLGNVLDLDTAIKYELHAHLLTKEDHPDSPEQLSHLGIAYIGRFKRLRDQDDLSNALKYSLQAKARTSRNHPDLAQRLSHLSVIYYERFKYLVHMNDLDKAIELRLEAYSLTPKDHPELSTRFGSLGAAYHERFMQLGDLGDLDMAIEYKQKALAATPKNHPQRRIRLGNLGTSYYERFMRRGELSELDKAIEYQLEANSVTPSGHPYQPVQFSVLGTSYHQKYLQQGNMTLLIQALTYFRQASNCVGGHPSTRLDAALDWARLAAGHNTPADLGHLQAYEVAIGLIPEVVWVGKTVKDRYAALELLNNVVTKASSAAIRDCRYDLALEWLEQGRSIVWNQILELRTPLDELHGANPSLADQLHSLREELQNVSLRASDTTDALRDSSLLEPAIQKHHQTATQYARLISEVRQLPGFENFLRPRPAAEIVLAARTGPLVVINIHNTSCDALIIQPGSSVVQYLELPYLTDQKVNRIRIQVELLHDRGSSTRRTNSTRRPLQSEPEEASETDLRPILATLWDDLANPVLKFLGHLTLSPLEKMPHITWCTTGPLTFIPLHAAGYYDRPHTKLSDYAVSSYTPTLGALLSLNSCSANHTSILAVGQETTSGLNNLPGTTRELVSIKDQVADNYKYQQLTDEDATPTVVLDKMAEHDWVHLACHAHQNIIEPCKSGFFLHDGILDLSAIMERSFKNKGLAFLSACQTATGDEKLADEAVHLASGMLIAGYPSVIATMWPVGDSEGPLVAGRVYGKLLKDGKMDYHEAARALHYAVEELKKEIGDDKFARWAPFIHVGL